MARSEKNNVEYFPHPVTHGKKMFYLRDKYGNDAYAVWFILLEQLGNANYHYLNLSDNISIKFLTVEMKVDEETLLNIINDLVEFEEFDEELWRENRILFNEKFVENIRDAYKKRRNDCVDKNSLLLLLHDKGIRKLNKSTPKLNKSSSQVSDNTQSKGKESKEDKSKVKSAPEYSVFLEYSLSKKPNVDKIKLKAKFDSWIANDWKDGNDKKITNWKSKILNTLPYIDEAKTTGTKFNSPII